MGEHDIVTSEILRNKFVAIVEDMRATLVHTAYSEAISQGHECANAILAESAKLIAADSALHMASLADTTADIVDYFEFDMSANDVIITNDPYGGGTGVSDLTLVAPVAHEDQIIMYLAVRARMSDMGGELLGGLNPLAREIWAEGVRITPVKVVRDGKLQTDVLTTILLNSRLPDAFRLDFDAMMGAIAIGKKRLSELLETYGLKSVLDSGNWALQYARRRLAAEISGWPDGEYAGECYLDHDGHGREGIAVRVTAKVAGGHLELDLSASDTQSSAFINSTYANSYGCALLPILSVVDQSMPLNSGLLDHVKITTRKGTAVDPELPAPTAWSHHHLGCEISEAVMSALARFIPERVANVAASMPLIKTIGLAARHGGTIEQLSNYDYSRFCQGNCDAACGRDGWGMPGVFADRPLPSIEVYEIEVGGSIEELELVTDSGGVGQWRGGLGNRIVIKLPQRSEDLLLTVCLETPHVCAHRLNGAKKGAICSAQIVTGGRVRTIESALVNEPLGTESKLVLQMAGGAGWGPAHKRELRAVLQDVLDGYVSLEAAARGYGVIIIPNSLEIDSNATRVRRSELLAASPL